MKKISYLDMIKELLGDEEFLKFQKCYNNPIKKSIKIINNRWFKNTKIDLYDKVKSIISEQRDLAEPDFSYNWNKYKDVLYATRKESLSKSSLWSHYLHQAWFIYVQEMAASIPVQVLWMKPWDKVLDICAAPWWKSIQIADKLTDWFLMSNEIDFWRRKALKSNLQRCWIFNAWIIGQDGCKLWDIFPENFEPSVMALFDYFLSKSHKEMKASYMGRILYACLDIIDKEEGLGVFLNEDFQKNFTTDDEIDVLEATDFTIYPIKPFDYFSHFCFNAQVIKRGNSNFLNYLKKLKEKFHEISFNFLFNEETKINLPSTNYCSILLMAYDATKNNLPTGDNFIIDYVNNFKNKIQYSNNDYILALKQYENSIHLIEEAKQKYKHISEGNN